MVTAFWVIFDGVKFVKLFEYVKVTEVPVILDIMALLKQFVEVGKNVTFCPTPKADGLDTERVTPTNPFELDDRVVVIPVTVIEAISKLGENKVPDEKRIPFPDW